MLTVEDLAFDENRAQPPVRCPARCWPRRRGSPVLVKYAACWPGLLVVVAFGVRPALRRAGSRRRPRRAAKGGVKELPASRGGRAPGLKPPEPAEVDPERLRTQEIFEQVTGHLKREPTQSSRLLQSWIHSD
jgi:flagellar M-ring protein FliF